MGVVRAVLVKDKRVVNVILVDPEQGNYAPPEGCELVPVGDAFGDIGDVCEGGRVWRKMRLFAEPNPATTGIVITVTAELEPDTPDSVVAFQVGNSSSFEVAVEGGRAEAAYEFSLPGTYPITASSPHHGSSSVEVVVE